MIANNFYIFLILYSTLLYKTALINI